MKNFYIFISIPAICQWNICNPIDWTEPTIANMLMRDSQLHWLNWAELSNPLNKPSSSSSQDVLSLLLCILRMPFDLVFSSCGWKLGHFGLAHLNGALLMLMRPSEPHCIALHWPALHCIALHRPNSKGFNLLSFNHDDKISAPLPITSSYLFVLIQNQAALTFFKFPRTNCQDTWALGLIRALKMKHQIITGNFGRTLN